MLTIAMMIVTGALGALAPAMASAPSGAGSAAPSAIPLLVNIVNFHFSPNTISQGSSTQGSFTITGGTPPFHLWVNNSAPGCAPPASPFETNNTSMSFSCNPSGTGSFNVHLDVVDSSTPVGRASAQTQLTVNPSSSGGSGSSGNNTGNGSGLNLPAGLFQVALLFGIVVLASIVAIAAGTIAIAISVSRRLRQINETLAKMQPPEVPKTPK